MCGIIGIAAKSNQVIKDYDWLKHGLNLMAHRGPDASSYWVSNDKNVVLGHRRLAIIDLSVDANQPMIDEQSNIAIVFNGEIYNYKELRNELISMGFTFKTKSDTEVVIKSYKYWGIDFVNHLNGMFALGLFDSQKQRLILARDRAGEKPLYYYNTPNSILFASEVKGLFANNSIRRKLSKEGINHYLLEGYVPGEQSIIENLKKVEPAQIIDINLVTGESSKLKYWSPPIPNINKNDDLNVLTDQLHAILRESIKNQLVSDVPIGVLLSGGVDSSLITAIASEVSSNVKTYSVSFKNSGKFDESPYSRLIANHFSTEHTEIEIDDTITPELLTTLAVQFDEPIIDSSMIPTFLIAKTIKKHCTVALGGDGADELFGGYNHYSGLQKLHQLGSFVPHFYRKLISDFGVKYFDAGYRGRNWIDALGSNFSENVPLVAKYFNQYDREKILNTNSLFWKECEMTWESRTRIKGNIIDRATRVDFDNYLVNDILVKVDRASMLASLEVRAPFLDKAVIEFAFGKVPNEFKVKNGRKKILLQELCKKILPQSFESNRKQGFSIPWDLWMKERKWKIFFEENLFAKDQVFFSHKEIKKLFTNQLKGYNNSERIFGLTMFYLWLKEYQIEQ